jgi:hypothetical protein
MNLRRVLENWQVGWAVRNRIRMCPPPGKPNSKVTGYVEDLSRNLFQPLSDRVRRQLISGAGGELRAPRGETGNMYAVYSSSALCVNCFHYWSVLMDKATASKSRAPLDVLLTACGLQSRSATGIDFEVPNPIDPSFKVAPHLDVQISFDGGEEKCAGIEAKFCEPYGGQKPAGLKPVYLLKTALWRAWPNIRAFAQSLSPNDLTHSHLHAAQLVKHLLGLRMQNGSRFVLVYLWFDVPGEEPATRHRREVEQFGEVLRRDGVAFVSKSYQEVFEVLRREGGWPLNQYVAYLLERYSEPSAA